MHWWNALIALSCQKYLLTSFVRKYHLGRNQYWSTKEQSLEKMAHQICQKGSSWRKMEPIEFNGIHWIQWHLRWTDLFMCIGVLETHRKLSTTSSCFIEVIFKILVDILRVLFKRVWSSSKPKRHTKLKEIKRYSTLSVTTCCWWRY